MAETLGSLCDKLTVVKLKQFHTEDPGRRAILARQEKQLKDEIDVFVSETLSGRIPVEKLTFAANKVFAGEGNVVAEVTGNIGEVFSQLADTNCMLWHEQEKVYEFEKVHPADKDVVVKQLALLNLKRTKCIDEIDRQFQLYIKRRHESRDREMKCKTSSAPQKD